MSKRLFVLGLDGFPHSFMDSLYFREHMPRLSADFRTNQGRRMASDYPVVSSVAWASYATGCGPGNHGVFGFTDPAPESELGLKLVNSNNLERPAFWNKLSRNMKIIVINVPMTYPVKPVNGIVVSDFLCPDYAHLTYPAGLGDQLKRQGYLIDADAGLVRQKPKDFLHQLITATRKRFELTFEFLTGYDWGFFQLHIMETDRLLHFFIQRVLQPQQDELQQLVDRYFQELDQWYGRLKNQLNNCALLVLSDHGFCQIKKEVQLTCWLSQEGIVPGNIPHRPSARERIVKSPWVAMTPGRLYQNRRAEFQGNCDEEELAERLLRLKNPETGESVIRRVFYRNKLYPGSCVSKAPNLLAHPNNGYDLKSDWNASGIFTSSLLTGMHTYDDAMIFGSGISIQGVQSIRDVADSILRFYKGQG